MLIRTGVIFRYSSQGYTIPIVYMSTLSTNVYFTVGLKHENPLTEILLQLTEEFLNGGKLR